MAQTEEAVKGIEDFKAGEEHPQLQVDEENAGFKLLQPVIGGKNVGDEALTGRLHSDEIGEQEHQAPHAHQVKEEDEDDESDGPPPGWGSILPLPIPSSPAVKVEQEQQLEEGRRGPALQKLEENHELEDEGERGEKVEGEEEEEDDDEIEGPPPGWGSSIHLPHPPSPANQIFLPFGPPATHDKVEEEDDDDQMEGPPPGWSSPSWQQRPSSTPPHRQSLDPPPLKTAHVFCKSCRRHLSYPKGSMQVRCSTCQIVNQTVEERAQMVCGFCRRLLSYPHGSKFIQCSLCKQVNYVLQEHEVGQVKCENCSELLMYPNGAPSVRCTKCHFVTDIGEHNKRPPLSVQQGRASPGTLAH